MGPNIHWNQELVQVNNDVWLLTPSILVKGLNTELTQKIPPLIFWIRPLGILEDRKKETDYEYN